MVQVSILVPVYKCENFVYKCADSLFSQTFEDVEFIFYDDCSPDNIRHVHRQIHSNDPRSADRIGRKQLYYHFCIPHPLQRSHSGYVPGLLR